MIKKKISLNAYIQQLTKIMGNLTIRTFHFNALMVNTMVLHDETKEAIIVDPGNITSQEDAQLCHYIESNQLTIKAIVNTHPHIDHIAGNQWCSETYGAPICCHANGIDVYNKAYAYAAAFGTPINDLPQPDRLLHEGDEIVFGNQRLQVLYTPGHCDGSISILIPNEKTVICGDLLFEGSIGRSDLPTGDGATLIKMIKEKILILDDDTIIIPGHGGTTTVGNEKLYNPFLV